MKFFKNPFKKIKMETNTKPPANEQGANETSTNETTNTENAVTEEVKPASIWRSIEERLSGTRAEFTDAVETSQGVLVKVTIVYASNNVSISMAFIPAVKIVEQHDGSLAIK